MPLGRAYNIKRRELSRGDDINVLTSPSYTYLA
jgi:hypothetical protein